MGRARIIIVCARLGRDLGFAVHLLMCLETITSLIFPHFISPILLQPASFPSSLPLSLSAEHHVCLLESTAFLLTHFSTHPIQPRSPHSKRNRLDREALPRQNKPKGLRCANHSYKHHVSHQGCKCTHHYDHRR